jgi:dihydroxyacid dehydratase/phosphogluconate dehydratase
MAMGCSTNAIIHLIAMARRAGQDIGLADFERYSRLVPVIGNVRPTGSQYVMEDFFYAGGIRALMGNIEQYLHLDCLTVNGKTIGENIEMEVSDDELARRRAEWVAPAPHFERGYGYLFTKHIQQADKG